MSDNEGIITKVGRPTKYRKEFCEELIEHMREGYSFDSFCANVPCRREVLYRWLARYPAFSHAKAIGCELALKYWETVMIQGISGNLKTEVTKTKQVLDADKKPTGEKIVETTTVPTTLSASPFIFMMKNRYGWKDRQDHEITGKDGGPIEGEIRVSHKELVAALRVAQPKDDLKDGFD